MSGEDRSSVAPNQQPGSRVPKRQVREPTRGVLKRLASTMPWLVTSGLAVLAGGLTAAAAAHAPTQPLVWMSAYLVLVAGMGQAGLGVGQAMLSIQSPSQRFVAAQWMMLNAANVGVVAGTLSGHLWLVAMGISGFVMALALFIYGVRNARQGWQTHLYRALAALLGIGATVGMTLSLLRPIR